MFDQISVEEYVARVLIHEEQLSSEKWVILPAIQDLEIYFVLLHVVLCSLRYKVIL